MRSGGRLLPEASCHVNTWNIHFTPGILLWDYIQKHLILTFEYYLDFTNFITRLFVSVIQEQYQVRVRIVLIYKSVHGPSQMLWLLLVVNDRRAFSYRSDQPRSKPKCETALCQLWLKVEFKFLVPVMTVSFQDEIQIPSEHFIYLEKGCEAHLHHLICVGLMCLQLSDLQKLSTMLCDDEKDANLAFAQQISLKSHRWDGSRHTGFISTSCEIHGSGTYLKFKVGVERFILSTMDKTAGFLEFTQKNIFVYWFFSLLKGTKLVSGQTRQHDFTLIEAIQRKAHIRGVWQEPQPLSSELT